MKRRTLEVISGNQTKECLEVAASRGSESPDRSGLRSILADLSLALVTLKEESGGCLATKMVINRAITTAHKILGTQNDQVTEVLAGNIELLWDK